MAVSDSVISEIRSRAQKLKNDAQKGSTVASDAFKALIDKVSNLRAPAEDIMSRLVTGNPTPYEQTPGFQAGQAQLQQNIGNALGGLNNFTQAIGSELAQPGRQWSVNGQPALGTPPFLIPEQPIRDFGAAVSNGVQSISPHLQDLIDTYTQDIQRRIQMLQQIVGQAQGGQDVQPGMPMDNQQMPQ